MKRVTGMLRFQKSIHCIRRPRSAPRPPLRTVMALALITAAGVLWLLASPASSFAQVSSGNATEYKVTVKNVSLCTSATCSSQFVIGSATKIFDIAAGGVGLEVGTYVEDFTLRQGVTITHVQIEFGRSFQITGSVDVGGGTICSTDSTATAGSILTPTFGKKTSTATSQILFIPEVGIFGGEPTEERYSDAGVTLVNSTTAKGVIALTAPFNVTDVAPILEIGFNTQSSVGAVESGGTCIMLVQPPVVTVTLQ